jgi:DNA-binding beta-propeller fold protein YncE
VRRPILIRGARPQQSAPPRAAVQGPALAAVLFLGSAIALLPLPARADDVAPPQRLVVDLAFGAFGVEAGQFNDPAGVAVDPKGRILVADTGNHRVERFDSSGVYVGEFGGFGHDAGRFDRPTALWVDGALAVWVLDQGNARVVKYDLEGRVIGVAVDLEADDVRNALGTVEPAGLAADRGGELFVTDAAADRVLAFDPLGAILDTRGGFGQASDRFGRPSGLAVDGRGRLLVADPGNRRVQLLDSFGGFLASFPLDSTLAANGRVVVAFGPDRMWAVGNRTTGALEVRTLDGATVARIPPGTKGGPLPGGLVFDAAGRLLVSDARGPRVLRYRLATTAP